MKNILWFSRHEMTPDQLVALEKAAGEEVKVNQINKTISSAFELQDEIAAADVVAIVAPINLQQQFLKLAGDRPVVMAVSERILHDAPDGGEPIAEFKFVKWERLLKVEVIKEDFLAM